MQDYDKLNLEKAYLVGIWIEKQLVLVSEVSNKWHGCSIRKLAKDQESVKAKFEKSIGSS